MKIIDVQQNSDVWQETRRGMITSTKAKGIRPLTRGADRTPVGFWKLLAEKVSVEPDGENVMDRGLRLEDDAVARTVKEFGLKNVCRGKVWVSDIDDDIGISPDAHQDTDKPDFAIEVKCFNSENHLKYVVKDKLARQEKNYSAFDNIPKDNQDQVLQYFVVNPDLQKLYFTLYDDRIAIDKYVHHVITVERDAVWPMVEDLVAIEKNVLEEVNKLIKEMSK